MIGNDIIDLRIGVGKYKTDRREKWLQKIALPSEISLLNKWPESLCPDILWSIKESVFKCRTRSQFTRSFNPGDVQLIELKHQNFKEGAGVVKWNQESFTIRFLIEKHWLHAVASYGKQELYWRQVCFHEVPDHNEQSLQLRSMFLSDISRRISGHWFVEKCSNGLPELINRTGMKIPVSFSHHGQFGAWATLEEHIKLTE
ncbi:MAG TPA: 4'-phosphopantetheinyl transferase superfamily protein [Saprospiraceae bacterium]|nr:4'-phosphopantetheinyl transferase superfamily protein [Saprospiraceae bacterium]